MFILKLYQLMILFIINILCILLILIFVIIFKNGRYFALLFVK